MPREAGPTECVLIEASLTGPVQPMSRSQIVMSTELSSCELQLQSATGRMTPGSFNAVVLAHGKNFIFHDGDFMHRSTGRETLSVQIGRLPFHPGV